MSEIQSWRGCIPVKIYSGPGYLKKLGVLLPKYGNGAIVTSQGWIRRGIVEIIENFQNQMTWDVISDVESNPQLDYLDDLINRFSKNPPKVIVAIGGGSAIDSAKALAAGISSELMSPLDQVFRGGKNHSWNSRIPLIAIPTTAGTGSEVTPYATVWDEFTGKKFSISGDAIFPTIALLDGELTLDLPPKETLYTSLDAVSHALESLWNKNRNPLSEAYANQALSLISANLCTVLNKSHDLLSRTRLLEASLLAGLAISQTKTAIAHSISYPLTIHYGVPHGLAAGFLLTELIDRHIDADRNNSSIINLEKIKSTLLSFDLRKEIEGYVRFEEILCLVDHMFDPARAENYLHEITADQLRFMLKMFYGKNSRL